METSGTRFRLLVAAAALAASVSASGATVTVNWVSGSFNPGGVNVGTITSPVGTTGADAGRFKGTVTSAVGINPAEFYQSPASLFAYCYDLAQVLASGTTYTVVPGAAPAVLDFLGAANAYLGGDNYGWLNVGSDSTLAAAIQLGIWEGLYDTGFALTTGALTFSSAPSAVSTIFGNIVGLMGTSPDLNGALVMVLSSERTQDVITGRVPLLVPEPGSLALLGLAAAAAGLIRRRKH